MKVIDNIRDKQVMILMNLVDRALTLYNLENGMSDFKELPLNDEITLDSADETGNLVVYAVTKFSVVTTKGEHIKFFRLDRDDIFTLQDIIADEYQLDINL